MEKEQIAHKLQKSYANFIQQLRELNETQFCFAPEGKWSAAEQLDHLLRSVKPVDMAMGLPKLMIKWKFGTANRPSKSYEDLIEKYNTKLKEGGRASGRFIPQHVDVTRKEKLLTQLAAVVEKLVSKTVAHSEEALDKYILPHPLLGKLTLREMLYFTIYHAEHHQQLVKKGLENTN